MADCWKHGACRDSFCQRCQDILENEDLRAQLAAAEATASRLRERENSVADQIEASQAAYLRSLQAERDAALTRADSLRQEREALEEQLQTAERELDGLRAKLKRQHRVRPVLEACAALVISTDAVGPLHMKGRPQIVSGTQAVAEAEWARRAAKEGT